MDNLFKVLGLEENYSIDLTELNEKYLHRLSEYHPDKAKDGKERERFLSYSVDLNNAYYCLKDELRRGEYILSLHNINLQDDSTRHLSKDILEQLWFEREQVEEENDLDSLKYLTSRKKKEKDEIIERLHQAFKDQDLNEATNLVIQLKYVHNFLKVLESKIKEHASNSN